MIVPPDCRSLLELRDHIDSLIAEEPARAHAPIEAFNGWEELGRRVKVWSEKNGAWRITGHPEDDDEDD